MQKTLQWHIETTEGLQGVAYSNGIISSNTITIPFINTTYLSMDETALSNATITQALLIHNNLNFTCLTPSTELLPTKTVMIAG